MEEEKQEQTIIQKGPFVGLDKVVDSCGCMTIIILVLFGESIYQLIKYAIDKFAK